MPKLRTRHQETVERIAGWLVGGRFGPGAALPNETEIGAELEVSRTVVREAMRTLVAKGMVAVRRRHGTTVRPVEAWSLFDAQVMGWRLKQGLSPQFIDDLVRFRLGIEPFAAGLAAENPEFDPAGLEAAYGRMSAAAAGEGDWHAADLDFHRAILLGSRNQFLRHLAPMMENALRVSFSLSVLSMDSARASLPMHRAVADAILDRDPERARRALSDLITSAREDIRVGLEPPQREHAARRTPAHGKGARLPVPTA